MFSLNLVYYFLDIEHVSHKNMIEEVHVNEIAKTWPKSRMLMNLKNMTKRRLLMKSEKHDRRGAC